MAFYHGWCCDICLYLLLDWVEVLARGEYLGIASLDSHSIFCHSYGVSL